MKKLILEIKKGNKKRFSIEVSGIPNNEEYEQVAFMDAGDEIPEILKKLGFMIEEYILRSK